MTNLIGELYTRYNVELRSYLKRKFGAGTAEAEDVVHQAFTNLAALDEPGAVQNPRAYLYRSTYHILTDERRRLSSWHRGVMPDLRDGSSRSDEITPERVLMAMEHLDLIGRVIGRLPHARRRSFLLNRLDGLSCAEIARRDGYSESAVKKHVTLAMAEVDAQLREAAPGASRRRVSTIAAACVAIAFAATAFVGLRPSAQTSRYATNIGEVREVPLPDGSVMTLGGHTSVEVRFADDRRQVNLLEGEAFFSVAHNVRRPFFVAVNNHELVRVVGTQFDVRRGSAEVRVDVLEGRVEVGPRTSQQRPGSAGTPRVLSAGQTISARSNGELSDPHEIGAQAAGAWRTGRLSYVDTPLREIVADINRYSRRQIVIADPQLQDLRLSVSFRTADPLQMLGSIGLALPVEVDRERTGDIVLHAREGTRTR